MSGHFSMPRTKSGGFFFLDHMLTSLSHRIPSCTTICIVLRHSSKRSCPGYHGQPWPITMLDRAHGVPPPP